MGSGMAYENGLPEPSDMAVLWLHRCTFAAWTDRVEYRWFKGVFNLSNQPSNFPKTEECRAVNQNFVSLTG